MKLILRGSLLTPPALGPPLVSEIMLKCWRREPKDRIRFPEINHLLQNSAPQSHLALRQEDLPLPPSACFDAAVEMLDQDQYLLPITMPPLDYLETIPDP